MASPSSGSPAPPSVAPNAITLHILSPAPEVTGGRITFPSISLDTTISQLKARLQNSISAAPPPERQRIIYRGRAVVDGSLTLESVFQSELDSSNPSSNHTLHLVLPPSPPSNNAPVAPPVTGTVPTTTQAPPAPQLVQQPHHGPHFPHQAIVQAQAAQMILQNQLNLLQQQLSMNNPIHASAEHVAQMQAQQHQRLAQQVAMHHQQQHHAHQPRHDHHAPQEQTRGHSGMEDTRNPDGSAHVNTTQSSQIGLGHPSGTPLTTGPTTTTVHEGIGPNGSRMRVVVNETINYHMSRQGTPVPSGTGMGQQRSANVTFHGSTNHVPNFPFLGAPGGPFPPVGLPLSQQNSLPAPSRLLSAATHSQHDNSPTSQANSANTTAWLLSTPVGPQALLFAPGHGLFSSAPTPTTAQLTNPNRTPSQHSTTHNRQSSTDHVEHSPGPLNNPPLPPAPNGANVAPAQALARPREQQGQANNNENDVFQFIFQRGWLFLRLYIFMFVVSEPGTWRRWFLLAVAVIVCLLPRDNPLRDLTNRIRAHIDGLIPITAAPAQRQQGQAAQNRGDGDAGGNEGQARPAAGPGVAHPSPEQAAARIVRQNQERQNHGIVRDTIFRVERAVALFLASLVPGVGERHVRAREEARREAERIENERLAAENARAAEEAAKNENNATADGPRQEMLGEPHTDTSM